MPLAAVTLDDKYLLEKGRVYLTGTQALVRLPMMQRQRDAAAGLNTGCFIAGYRGSPLGNFDRRCGARGGFSTTTTSSSSRRSTRSWARPRCGASQQIGLFPGAQYDGVFAIWYGKGPGVDRSGDPLKHGNSAGTAPFGGVLAIAGDDHTCKSSTLAHQSELAFIDASIPILNPAGVEDILDLGLYGWAMSRYSGCWVGFKTVAETMDSSASVTLHPDRVRIVLPEDFQMPPGGLSIRWPDTPLDQEIPAAPLQARCGARICPRQSARPHRHRQQEAALRHRHNGKILSRSAPGARRSRHRRRTRPRRSGFASTRWRWPGRSSRRACANSPKGSRKSSSSRKNAAVIEPQLKEQLYNWPATSRPRIVGKYDEDGDWILPSPGELSPAQIARVIAKRIARFHASPRVAERLAFLETREAQLSGNVVPFARTPYFCSGCPHNTSTKVPEGSRALAGIGCHYLSQFMDRSTATFSQMGGEGAAWIGQSPFVETQHVFANIGDGTYTHSGILAIRAAVAAKVNMTYKVLFNDAVAMTGGQPLDGGLTVPIVARQLAAEGVGPIVIVSDEPEKYPPGTDFPPGATVRHRDDLDQIQRDIREFKGVSAIVYDQTCAAEKRRRRKRGRFPDPAKRVVINDLVCEGCGDCSTQSNCLSVTPVETEFGRKRGDRPVELQQGFLLPQGLLPELCDRRGRQPQEAQRRR